MDDLKFFKPEEINGLEKDLVYKLERARDLFGAPIVITSGYRDPNHNESIGGVKDSSHEHGLAVDIKCADSELQKKLIWALCIAGFRRVGVYDRHLHCDIDNTKPTPVYWTGISH